MKKLSKIIPKFLKFLFLPSIIIAVGIDAYFKFDVPDDGWPFNVAICAYLYFCFYIAVLLSRQIIKIQSWIIKLVKYICLWAITILVFDVTGPTNEGIRGSLDFVIVIISFFSIILLTLYFFYKVIFKNFGKISSKFFRLLFKGVIFLTLISIAFWFYLNKDNETNKIDKETKVPLVTPVLIQPWQLNSRFKINKIVKFLKVDLDKDGKEEIAAITSYDKLPDDVFYYAEFYRYNPATEIWDQFYGEELNILNYSTARDEIEAAKLSDFVNTFINMWSTEFTTLENIGDITGDNCPEIVFSSLLQGKNFDNYLIVAQAGKSHFHYRIFLDQNTMAKIVVEDNMLIEKYYDQNYDYKDIYEWDDNNLRFKLIESQKKKTIVPETPKVIPELEGLSV